MSDVDGKVRLEKPPGWVLLAMGTVFVFASFGPFTNPVTPWFALVFFLRYLRQRPMRKGLLPVFLCFALGFGGSCFLLLLPLGPIGVVLILPDLFAFFLPLVAARWRMNTVNGIGATLVLPCTAVVVESVAFLAAGSAGTWSYSQFGFYPVMQVASLTGIAGITFLLMWSASVIEYVWNERFVFERTKRVLSCFCVVLLGVMLYGSVRLLASDFDDAEKKVKMAMITNETSYLERFKQLGEDYAEAVTKAGVDREKMLERTREAASNGAKIVLWQEYGAYVPQAEEWAFLKAVGDIAKAFGVYVVPSVGGISSESAIPTTNRLFWIGPDGKLLNVHHKYRTVPGFEPPARAPEITAIETEYGKMAGVICADADVPHIVKRAGKEGVEVLLVATQDWKEFRWFHNRFPPFRAIENGFSLMKAAGDGISGSFDPFGRPLASRDWFESDDRILYSDVPVRSVATFYPTVGFLFPLFCLVGLVWLVALGSFQAEPVADRDRLSGAVQ